MFDLFKRPSTLELKPLPMNMPEFHRWSERIILKASLPTDHMDSQKFALAGMILQTAPTDFLRPDEYYVNLLRKAASDQVATQVITDLQEKRAQKLASQAPTKLEAVNDRDPA